MSEADVLELINRLQDLQVQQKTILAEERRLVARLRNAAADRTNRPNRGARAGRAGLLIVSFFNRNSTITTTTAAAAAQS